MVAPTVGINPLDPMWIATEAAHENDVTWSVP